MHARTQNKGSPAGILLDVHHNCYQILHLQCYRWLQNHGVCREAGAPCERPACTGSYVERVRRRTQSSVEGHPEHTTTTFRCNVRSCRHEASPHGQNGFFHNYEKPNEAIAVIYCLAKRIPLRHIREEIGHRGHRRTAEMLNNLGVMCEVRLEELFVSRVGRCEQLQIDESFLGARKHNRGARAREQAKWYMCVCEIDQTTRKVKTVFFEPVPGPQAGYRSQQPVSFSEFFCNFLK